MKKLIKLESLYTPYTLDGYQTFTLDGAVDCEIYNYNKENNTKYDYDDFDWDFNTGDYLKDLAENRLKLLKKNILNDVILDIKKDGEPISPAYYNFTTDKVFNDYLVDLEKLNEYIQENRDDFNKNKIDSAPGFIWLGDEEQTKLEYYLRNKSKKDYSQEDYYFDQVEDIQEYEYIDFKLINNK